MTVTTTAVPRLLDRVGLQSAYGIAWKTALSWGKDGLLKVIRIGRKCYVDRDEVERIIADGGRRFPGGWRRQAPGM
jgi:hypothetical protein